MEETLSDGSKVYDVNVGNVLFHLADYAEAVELFRKISVVALTVCDDGGD